MTITPDQRRYAWLAGIMIFANIVLQGFGDSVTIIARRGESFAETARFVSENMVLWRFCLLNVGLSWIAIGVLAFALYVVVESVNKRLAQLAFVLRLGASFVGASSLMFRVAQAQLYSAVNPESPFTTEQLRILVSVAKRGSGEGVETAWLLQFTGSLLFYVLFLRSGYVPRWLAWSGIVSSALFIGASAVMFVFPQRINELKLVGLPCLFVEVGLALLFLIKGLPRATGEAKA